MVCRGTPIILWRLEVLPYSTKVCIRFKMPNEKKENAFMRKFEENFFFLQQSQNVKMAHYHILPILHFLLVFYHILTKIF